MARIHSCSSEKWQFMLSEVQTVSAVTEDVGTEKAAPLVAMKKDIAAIVVEHALNAWMSEPMWLRRVEYFP
ncbi:unnamed protein product (plasmid) [Mycetohabitans rhizoxinica HKI 454]|jgi:uncharacterized membrane protein YbaN (DUF454 family)|uniref:Uncharacterized protein n=2 Tax=Mycetohabitans TaxID=2571159 RepID=E5AVX8_MYCRK|nr:unnamed protein product [Mycetohabitans rhizoxinica HKI 454]